MPDGGPISPGTGLTVATDERPVVLTGTVAKTAASPTVTGTGTLFLTELSVGETIRVPGTADEDRVISAIASNTSLTVTANFANSASAQVASRVQHYQITDSLWSGLNGTGTCNLNGSVAGPFPCVGMSSATIDITGVSGTLGIGRMVPQCNVAGRWVGMTVWRIDTVDPNEDSGITPAGVGSSQSWRCGLAPGATEFRILAVFDLGISTTVNVGLSSQPDPRTIIGGQRVQRTTYSADFRLAARPYALSAAMTANSRKQFATMCHLATRPETVKLRRVLVEVIGNTVASILTWELIRITSAPATGNPTITPTGAYPADVATTTCLALPTTAGTEGARYSSRTMNLGVVGAAPTTNPPPFVNAVELLPAQVDPEVRMPTIRPLTLEGWAVILDSSGASTVTAEVTIEFTEQ
jgi:hypothetical protein